MKNIFFVTVILLFISACSRYTEITDGFVLHLAENKEKIYLHRVNVELTRQINKIYHENGGNIFDENGEIIGGFIILDDNKLFVHYGMFNNFEIRYRYYKVLYEKSVHIGAHITKINAWVWDNDIGISVICHLDDEGSRMLHEFTTDNINERIAIVFDNKVIAQFAIFSPITRPSIGFFIGY